MKSRPLESGRYAGGSAGVVIASYLVAYAAASADEGVVGAGIDFTAQVVDVDVGDVGDGIAVDAPDLVPQPFWRGLSRCRWDRIPRRP